MDIKDLNINSESWSQAWAGNWGLLFCSASGEFYTKILELDGQHFVRNVIFVFHNGKTAAWFPDADLESFRAHVASLIRKDSANAERIVKELKDNTDSMQSFMKENFGKDISYSTYVEYWQRIRKYYAPHIEVKYVVDTLSPEELDTFLPILQEGRLYAEPVFSEITEFDTALARVIAQKVGYSHEAILFLTQDEFKEYFESGVLPEESALLERHRMSILACNEQGYQLFGGAEALKIEAALLDIPSGDVIKGSVGYAGKTTGRVRVVLDPSKEVEFNQGDILVTGMTRPDYLHLMTKAGAIVTDSGGVLSHAAITSRELKLPCVIGTKVATKVLKDGDMVEIDANEGVVKIIR